MSNFRVWALAAAALSVAGLATPARAQDPDDARRGVARISMINGEVSVKRGDSGDWVAGVINAPLLTDDRIATGPNSRAEVEFDASNVLRIGSNAEVHLAQLEYNRNQLELAHGIVTYRILRNSDVNVEIDTPSVSVRPSRQGSYRISVNDAGETEVTARGGDVEVFTPRGSQWVRSGQTMMARGAASDPEFQIVAAGGMDEWDRWCESRDHMMLQSRSSRYVPQGVYGAEDLDNYGNWVQDPDYGYVWQPTVVADWAPYHYGRWAWEDWYGWTWVSYDPWGWAPYHYGRWFHGSRGWCWYPGVIGVRHYWSPALVGWIGFGGGGGFGFGFGNIGWVPLAPYETFHPWWGRGFYGRGFNQTNINITNVNVTNVYRNSRVNNGISAVGVHDFQNGRFNNVGRFNGTQVGTAGALRGAMPFAPAAQNMRFTDRQASMVPRTTANTAFFRHQQPTPVQRMPVGRASGVPGGQGVQQAAPQNGFRGGDNGFRRFGAPAGQGGAPQVNQPAAPRGGFGSTGRNEVMRNDRPSPQVNQPGSRNENRGGWNRFGSPGNNPVAPPAAPRQEPRQNPQMNDRPRFNGSPNGNGGGNGGGNSFGRQQEPLRIAPPVVRERPNAPAQRYEAPRYQAPPQQRYEAPRYQAPPQQRNEAPRYQAPPQQHYEAPRYSPPPQQHQSAPSYSAPRGGGGGGGGGGHQGGGGGNGGGNNGGGHGGGGGHGRR
jgi:hypothetical protein